MNRGQRRASWLVQHRNAIRAARGAPGSGLNARGVSSSGQVHVEELVLHGFPAASGHSIGDATQQELIRMLTTRGLPAQMMQDTTHVSAGSFQLPPGAKPKAIGALVTSGRRAR